MHDQLTVKRSILGATLAAALAFGTPALAAPPNYTMTFLGSFGSVTAAAGINNQGNVVGYALAPSGTSVAPYAIYSDGSTTTRFLGGAANSEAFDINNNGQVVGTTPYDAVILDLNTNTVVASMPNPGGPYPTIPWAINDNGQVAGHLHVGPSTRHAFFYDGTTVHDLGTLAGAGTSLAWGINNLGHVVGSSVHGSQYTHPFLYDGTTMRDLGVPPGVVDQWLDARAINDSDQVVVLGAVGTLSSSVGHTFRYDAGTWSDLGLLFPNRRTLGEAINNSGHIVGYGETGLSTDPQHGFLHDGTALYDLNDLIDPADPYKSDFRVEDATAINDSDEIAVSACRASNIWSACYAFLLKPVTTTASAP